MPPGMQVRIWPGRVAFQCVSLLALERSCAPILSEACPAHALSAASSRHTVPGVPVQPSDDAGHAHDAPRR